jgi:hypothetical protein
MVAEGYGAELSFLGRCTLRYGWDVFRNQKTYDLKIKYRKFLISFMDLRLANYSQFGV